MPTCPSCAEELTGAEAKCPLCGEPLAGQVSPAPRSGGLGGWWILLIGCGVLAVGAGGVAVVAAVAIPSLITARQQGNEVRALGTLETISAAQSLFQEGDEDQNGRPDYGDLDELARASLVPADLNAERPRFGYRFDCRPSATAPEERWMATASPVEAGRTGRRWFAINQDGVLFESADGPIELDPDAPLPPPTRPDVRPAGQ